MSHRFYCAGNGTVVIIVIAGKGGYSLVRGLFL